MRVAMERRDAALMEEAMSPGIVVFSPVTATPIEGRDAAAELMRHVMDGYERWECVHEFADGPFHALAIRGRFQGHDVEIFDYMLHDESGKVREMRLHGRPLSALAGFAAYAGPRIALAHGGRLRWLFVKLLTAPLPRLLALGDRALWRFGLPGYGPKKRT